MREGESMDGRRASDRGKNITYLRDEVKRSEDIDQAIENLENMIRTKNYSELFASMGDYPRGEFPTPQDMVNSPKHYEILPGVEVYDVREAILKKHPQLEPNVVDDWSRSWEYLTRMFGKNGLEDAKKSKWYLEKLIERMENE